MLNFDIGMRSPIIKRAMCVGMCVCMFAIGTRAVGARGLKFGTELGFHPKSVFAQVRTGRTSPPGRGSLKSGSGGPCSRHRGFLGKLHKTKVEEHPRYSGGGLGQIRSSTSPRGPADRPVQGVGLLLWSQG